MRDHTNLAVILDVDGTLCDVTTALHHILDRSHPKDFESFHKASLDCPPHDFAIQWALSCYALDFKLIVVTSRKERNREITEAWVDRNLPAPYVKMHMRGNEDGRPSPEVKRDNLALIRGEGFKVIAAIDDDESVLAMYESQGVVAVAMPWTFPGETR